MKQIESKHKKTGKPTYSDFTSDFAQRQEHNQVTFFKIITSMFLKEMEVW